MSIRSRPFDSPIGGCYTDARRIPFFPTTTEQHRKRLSKIPSQPQKRAVIKRNKRNQRVKSPPKRYRLFDSDELLTTVCVCVRLPSSASCYNFTNARSAKVSQRPETMSSDFAKRSFVAASARGVPGGQCMRDYRRTSSPQMVHSLDAVQSGGRARVCPSSSKGVLSRFALLAVGAAEYYCYNGRTQREEKKKSILNAALTPARG